MRRPKHCQSSHRRRLIGIAAAAGLAGLLLTAAPAVASPVPVAAPRSAVPVPALPSGLAAVPLDPATPYLPQNSCDDVLKPGVAAFERLIRGTYPGTGTLGDSVPCGTDGTVSEHFEGRAWDWGVSARVTAQKADADTLVAWLIANNAAMARRFGLMYIIWNDRIWGIYSAASGWRPYSNCPTGGATACHEDHVHFSFGWAGAQQRTSWWTGKPAPVDYGPCRVAWLTYAPPDSGGPNASGCPAVPAAPAATPLQRWSGAVLRPGSYGPAVTAVQRAVGVTDSGPFGPQTETALLAFQRAHGLPATGVTDIATWRALLGLTQAVPKVPTSIAATGLHACAQCFGRAFAARLPQR